MSGSKLRNFNEKWNFPRCIGAIDGKHNIVIQCAKKSDSEFLNYKGTHNIILMAVVGAHYSFINLFYQDHGENNKIT